MKNRLSLVILFLSFGVVSPSVAQQTHLDVLGHAKIRGNIDINHMDDTTSVIIGRNAGMNTDFTSRRWNTYVGSNAGKNATAANNSFFGEKAGYNQISGGGNCYFGWTTGYSNDGGVSNSFFGTATGKHIIGGQGNAFFGNAAGHFQQSGDHNSYFGREAGYSSYHAKNNTFIGAFAGKVRPDSLEGSIAIGYMSEVRCNQCAVIGGTGADVVNVGIGIDSPQTRLHVTGDHLRLSSSADVDRFIQFRTDGTALDLEAIGGSLYINAGSFVAMGLGSTNVGVGTDNPMDKFQVGTSGDGTLARANKWDVFSDLRWKTDLSKINDPFSKLKSISGYYYYWKDGKDQSRQIGVIAQEVEKVLPEAVSTDLEGYKSVEYGKLSALLIEVIKAQQKRD